MTAAILHANVSNRRFMKTALVFMIFFLGFTQYDVLVGGKVNYLLITVPLLSLLTVVAHLWAFRAIRLPKNAAPLLALYSTLGIWVLIAGQPAALFNYILLAAVLVNAAMLACLWKSWPEIIETGLRLFIWANVAALLFQVAWFAVTRSQIDLHNMLFPFSRVSEISADHGFGFVRFNGFQLEPGSFAANLGTATMLHYGLTRRISWPMIALVLLTLLITRSASASIYFVAISATAYIAALKASRRTLLVTPLIAVALAGLVMVSGFDDYIANRFLDQNIQQISQQDGSARYKIANLQRLATADTARQILGSGFMNVDCDACGFVNSNGAGFALVFFFGVWGGVIAVLLLVLGATRSAGALLLILMLLLSRHTFVQPAFWIPIVFLMVDRNVFGRARPLS